MHILLSDLKRGDLVVSYENDTLTCSKIVASDNYISKTPIQMIKIGFGNGKTLSMTSNHIIYAMRDSGRVENCKQDFEDLRQQL